jgi:hypothetical protein
MNKILHLVMETPGANASGILLEATQDDSPSPDFYFYNSSTNDDLNVNTWSLSNDGTQDRLEFKQTLSSPEIFMFLSHEITMADQLEAILRFQKSNDQITMGRILLFIHAPVLLEEITSFQEWLDAVVHFSDAILFVDRTNENASAIKILQERYTSMRYPLENYILAKRNNPWSRILDPSPRRISHIFDDIELLEPEDYPENDRYLKKSPSGERERSIPLTFAK